MAAQLFNFAAPLPGRLYWDASFLIHATYPAGRYHQECFALLDRLSNARGTVSYVSTLVLDETVFGLLQLKVAGHDPTRGFWGAYRDNPQVIQPFLPELRRLLDRLTSDPRIQIVGAGEMFVWKALDHMESYSLLPRDALHLTTMAEHAINSVVTTDADFLPINGLRIYTCNPKMLASVKV